MIMKIKRINWKFVIYFLRNINDYNYVLGIMHEFKNN